MEWEEKRTLDIQMFDTSPTIKTPDCLKCSAVMS